ncbi:MAG TPA: hypothetical protein VIF86_05880 [Methylobacter sp.]
MGWDSDEPGEQTALGRITPEARECLRCGICIASCPAFRLFFRSSMHPHHQQAA